MIQAQWQDPSLLPLLHNTRRASKHPDENKRTVEFQGDIYRFAPDRGLEVAVSESGSRLARWVLVVPTGGHTPNQTWKAFFFFKYSSTKPYT